MTAPPRQPGAGRCTEQQILLALKQCGGQPVMTARTLQRAPAEIGRRIARSARLRSERQALQTELFEMAVLILRQSITAGKSWAVSLALRSLRGDQTLVAAEEVDGPLPGLDRNILQKLLEEVLRDEEFLEFCRSRGVDRDAGGICPDGIPGEMDCGAAPAGDRPGDSGGSSAAAAADPGD